jgi:ATP-dependent DNA helicase RecQ
MSASAQPATSISTPIDERLAVLTVRQLDLLDVKLLWRLNGYFRTKGDFDRAQAVLECVARRGRAQAQLTDERAKLAAARGDFAVARALYEERVAQSPVPTSYAQLGRFLLERGELEQAQKIADNLLRDHADLVTVLGLAAEVAIEAGEPDTARGLFLDIADRSARNTSARFSLARLALDEGDLDEAATHYREALEIAGDDPNEMTLEQAAGIAEELGHHADAAAFRERAAVKEAARIESLVEDVRLALADAPEEHKEATAPETPDTAALESAATEEPDREVELEGELDPRVLETLRRDFGHNALRPGQERVMRQVLADRDTLAVMPTGAGKSLTFQLPAMIREGTTLVISPLIALMKDQVESLPEPVRARTALINSTLSGEEYRSRLAELRDGTLKLVYVAPERLRDHQFLRALRGAGVSLVVIDEAHCISMWGHDFRPDYLFIPKALVELGDPTVLAITATATPAMAREIGRRLNRNLSQLRVSVFRSNLYYEVYQVQRREEKLQKLLTICSKLKGAGIVYVGSRKDAESIAGLLSANRISALPYHAGLDPAVRAHNQETFMAGAVRVVVATVAFGMGVDKADVRFIVHFAPPASLEAYAQESGRAGRDQERARCILLSTPTDEPALKRMAKRDEISIDELRRVYREIRAHARGDWAILDRNDLESPSQDEDDYVDPKIAIGILEQANLLVRHPDAPRSYEIWLGRISGEPATPLAQQVRDWLAEEIAEQGSATIETALACRRLGVSPSELDRAFSEIPGWRVRDGQRGVCLQLLPAEKNANAVLTGIIDRAADDANRRIRQVMAYVRGTTCRHVVLADHLGEHLAPCEKHCDNCTRPPVPASEREPIKRNQRSYTTAEDALATLRALKTIPFPVGKTGLSRLMAGSVESRIRADRSPEFGALAALSTGKIEGLIDQLIEEDFLFRDLDHEYKLISLTAKGRDATLRDLAEFDTRTAHQKGGAISDEDTAIVERLRAWRREKATQDQLPPYLILHDSVIHNLATARPATHAELARVPGIGTAKLESLGDDILRILSEM